MSHEDTDHGGPEVRYRSETFGYGPKAYAQYRPGPTCKVSGRKGVTWEEAEGRRRASRGG